MKTYPALSVHAVLSDVLLSIADDLSATALEERDDGVRVFFSTSAAREAASATLGALGFAVEAVDVGNEDWARRSQSDLRPVVVGDITIAPPWAATAESSVDSRQSTVTIVINPSIGFGTGHHATTRLCLEALQAISLAGAVVVDAGTGSGILAIASARLGAARVVGIDNDPDAIESANENLILNSEARNVEFRVADLKEGGLPLADVVTANLTGTLLAGASTSLLAVLRPGGTLIVSGILAEERDEVGRALGVAGPHEARPTYALDWERQEDEWVGMAVRRV